MNELSLFTGAGGGVLASLMLGHRIIGYVEWDKYCQQIIKARIDDGIYEKAPIFTDVREFVQSGAAREYRGFTDLVSGGFPCQAFSVAGKQKGIDDPRNMWPTTIAAIREIRPKIVFLENVPGLLAPTTELVGALSKVQQDLFNQREKGQIGTHVKPDIQAAKLPSYFGVILRDLAESGYAAEWCVLGTDDIGGIHRRKRVWIYAVNTDGKRIDARPDQIQETNGKVPERDDHANVNQSATRRADTTNTNGHGHESGSTSADKAKQQGRTKNNQGRWEGVERQTARGDEVSNATGTLSARQWVGAEQDQERERESRTHSNANCELDNTDTRSKRRVRLGQEALQRVGRLSWCENIRSIKELQDRPDIPQPLIRGVDDGMANRANRTRAIGNGQDPLVAAAAFRILEQRYWANR